MILLLLLTGLSQVASHMPIFGDGLHIENTKSKSYGIYVSIEDSYSLTMNVAKGENISFSLSVPDYYEKQAHLKVTLFGHGANQIVCDSKFNGWGFNGWGTKQPDRRRLDTTTEAHIHEDSTKQIPVYNTEEKVFEPFGVAGYRPIAACQGEAEIGDKFFKLTITNQGDEPVPISIGVGMAESFGFVDLLFMSFTIMQTWLWAGKYWSLVIPIAAVLWYVLFLMDKTPDIFIFTMLKIKGKHQDYLQKVAYLCGLFMFVNAVQFLSQMGYTWLMGAADSTMWLSFLLHVLLPIIAYYAFYLYFGIDLKVNYGTIKHWGFGILFIAYTFALLWQSYCIPLLSFVMFFVLKLYYTSSYTILPTDTPPI